LRFNTLNLFRIGVFRDLLILVVFIINNERISMISFGIVIFLIVNANNLLRDVPANFGEHLYW
jgi:hypothetical protein